LLAALGGPFNQPGMHFAAFDPHVKPDANTLCAPLTEGDPPVVQLYRDFVNMFPLISTEPEQSPVLIARLLSCILLR
jgi:hypothetical protein